MVGGTIVIRGSALEPVVRECFGLLIFWLVTGCFGLLIFWLVRGCF